MPTSSSPPFRGKYCTLVGIVFLRAFRVPFFARPRTFFVGRSSKGEYYDSNTGSGFLRVSADSGCDSGIDKLHRDAGALPVSCRGKGAAGVGPTNLGPLQWRIWPSARQLSAAAPAKVSRHDAARGSGRSYGCTAALHSLQCSSACPGQRYVGYPCVRWAIVAAFFAFCDALPADASRKHHHCCTMLTLYACITARR